MTPWQMKASGESRVNLKSMEGSEMDGLEEKKQMDIPEKQRWEIIWLIPEKVAAEWLSISNIIGLYILKLDSLVSLESL